MTQNINQKDKSIYCTVMNRLIDNEIRFALFCNYTQNVRVYIKNLKEVEEIREIY